MKNYLRGVASLQAWAVGTALPFWSTRGFDSARARFHERLDWSGRPLRDVAHRAMVQARQIYVFAHAAWLGWYPEGAEFAELAMRSLLRDYRDRSGKLAGFAFSIDREKAVVSSCRDAYSHAFILFALAWLHRLDGAQEWLDAADETIAFIDSSLADAANGGVFDAFPVEGRGKKQNPHMHLLEAYLALEASAPGRGYGDRACELVSLFRQRMFDAPTGTLPETFAEDWGAPGGCGAARAFEPGHHFEWLWLLCEFESVTGKAAGTHHWRMEAQARAHGVTAGFRVFDEVDAAMQVRKSSHRLWTHAEAAKAGAARRAHGDAAADAFIEAIVATLRRDFLGRPFAAGWIDHIGPEGQPIVDYVPASSLYHVFLAVAELARVCGDGAFPAARPPVAAQTIHA